MSVFKYVEHVYTYVCMVYVNICTRQGLLCLGLESYRTRSRDLDFEDLDVKELDPADGIPSDLSTNDIPIFPFPTVSE